MGGVDEFFVILRLRPGAADSDGVLGFKGRGYILAKRLARLLLAQASAVASSSVRA